MIRKNILLHISKQVLELLVVLVCSSILLYLIRINNNFTMHVVNIVQSNISLFAILISICLAYFFHLDYIKNKMLSYLEDIPLLKISIIDCFFNIIYLCILHHFIRETFGELDVVFYVSFSTILTLSIIGSIIIFHVDKILEKYRSYKNLKVTSLVKRNNIMTIDTFLSRNNSKSDKCITFPQFLSYGDPKEHIIIESDKFCKELDESFNNETCFKKNIHIIKNRIKQASNHKEVIAITGIWGIGKTTFINTILDKINTEYEKDNKNVEYLILNDDDIKIWDYSSNEKLCIAFLEKIFEVIKLKINPLTLRLFISEILSNYMSSSTISNKIANLFYPDDSLVKTLNNYLDKENKRIIIVFDNLDRVKFDKVEFVLRIVSDLIDIKRITYILCYEKTIMQNNINNYYFQFDLKENVNEEIVKSFLDKFITEKFDFSEMHKSHTVEIFNIAMKRYTCLEQKCTSISNGMKCTSIRDIMKIFRELNNHFLIVNNCYNYKIRFDTMLCYIFSKTLKLEYNKHIQISDNYDLQSILTDLTEGGVFDNIGNGNWKISHQIRKIINSIYEENHYNCCISNFLCSSNHDVKYLELLESVKNTNFNSNTILFNFLNENIITDKSYDILCKLELLVIRMYKEKKEISVKITFDDLKSIFDMIEKHSSDHPLSYIFFIYLSIYKIEKNEKLINDKTSCLVKKLLDNVEINWCSCIIEDDFDLKSIFEVIDDLKITLTMYTDKILIELGITNSNTINILKKYYIDYIIINMEPIRKKMLIAGETFDSNNLINTYVEILKESISKNNKANEEIQNITNLYEEIDMIKMMLRKGIIFETLRDYPIFQDLLYTLNIDRIVLSEIIHPINIKDIRCSYLSKEYLIELKNKLNILVGDGITDLRILSDKLNQSSSVVKFLRDNYKKDEL